MGWPKISGTRADSQVQLVKRMAGLCTRIVPDDEGADLFYINGEEVQNEREAKIEERMKTHLPTSGTPIGTKLREKILDPFVYRVMRGPNKQFQRPLFITIITDGEPSREANNNKKALEEAVLECLAELKKNGYPEHGRDLPYIITMCSC